MVVDLAPASPVGVMDGSLLRVPSDKARALCQSGPACVDLRPLLTVVAEVGIPSMSGEPHRLHTSRVLRPQVAPQSPQVSRIVSLS